MYQRHAKRMRGLVPTRSATIRDENGNPCTTTDTQHQRRRRHFSNVLNIPSQFNEVELARIRQRPIKSQLADLRTNNGRVDQGSRQVEDWKDWR